MSAKRLRYVYSLLLPALLLGSVYLSACLRQAGQRDPAAEEPGTSKIGEFQPANCSVGLALPLSGPYALLGARLLDGARVAQKALAERGVSVEVLEVDTDAPDWKDKLAALPPQATVVGGPLRLEICEELKQSGLLRSRAFFGLLQNLSEGLVEGRDAWRFFSSPTDQLRTLLQSVRRDFGINAVGVLYPDEPFGKRVAQLFQEQALREGITVTAIRDYPPDDPLLWKDIVADFLCGKKAASGCAPAFEAIFLPDVWSKVEMLVPLIHYHGQEQQLILGSTLWGQTMSKTFAINPRSFRLSMFPGLWQPRGKSPAVRDLARFPRTEAKSLEPDVWEAIGYDFIQFASRLGVIPSGWTPEVINRRIQGAQAMPWSIAPISWNAVGEARQHLFLFSPTDRGLAPADIPAMRQRIGQAKVQGR